MSQVIDHEVEQSQDVEQAPELIHIADTCCPPFVRAWCGKSLEGDGELPKMPGATADCMVCVEMDKANTCTRCKPKSGRGFMRGRPW